MAIIHLCPASLAVALSTEMSFLFIEFGLTRRFCHTITSFDPFKISDSDIQSRNTSSLPTNCFVQLMMTSSLWFSCIISELNEKVEFTTRWISIADLSSLERLIGTSSGFSERDSIESFKRIYSEASTVNVHTWFAWTNSLWVIPPGWFIRLVSLVLSKW